MMWERRHLKRTSFVDPSWFKSSGKLISVDEHLIYKESPKNEKS